MRTYKVVGNGFEVTFSAYTFQTVDLFGQPAYSFVRYDWSEVCSILCADILSMEVLA